MISLYLSLFNLLHHKMIFEMLYQFPRQFHTLLCLHSVHIADLRIPKPIWSINNNHKIQFSIYVFIYYKARVFKALYGDNIFKILLKDLMNLRCLYLLPDLLIIREREVQRKSIQPSLITLDTFLNILTMCLQLFYRFFLQRFLLLY